MQLKQYHIKPAQCTGCHTCMAVCPTGAITLDESGKPQIKAALCNRCGICRKKCKSRAITYSVRLQF